jgi:hypothetical protein
MKMERNENAQEDAFWEFFGEKTKQKTEFTTSRDLKTRPDRRPPPPRGVVQRKRVMVDYVIN